MHVSKATISNFLKLAASELDAGHCNLSDAEVSALLDIFARARSRASGCSSSAEVQEIRRIEEGFCYLSDKVDRLDSEVGDLKVLKLKK